MLTQSKQNMPRISLTQKQMEGHLEVLKTRKPKKETKSPVDAADSLPIPPNMNQEKTTAQHSKKNVTNAIKLDTTNECAEPTPRT